LRDINVLLYDFAPVVFETAPFFRRPA